MRAGALKESIDVYQPGSYTVNAYGEQVDTWNKLTTVRARILMSTASDMMLQSVEVGASVLAVEIRYLQTVHENMRIVYESVSYDIKKVQHKYRKVTQLYCKEVQA